jgi:hypothetical protein
MSKECKNWLLRACTYSHKSPCTHRLPPRRPSETGAGSISLGSVGPDIVGFLDPELVLSRGGSCVPGEGGSFELEGRENHLEGLDKKPVIEEGEAARGNERNVEEEGGGVTGKELESGGR